MKQQDHNPLPPQLTRRGFVGLGALAATTLASSSLLIACTGGDKGQGQGQPSGAKTRTVTNLDGTDITIPDVVTKVAAVFGPAYERIVAVGAEDRIACDGDYHISGWPWSNVVYARLNEVPGIPNAHSDLNIEDLIGMGVQLVFSFPNPQQTESINNGGLVAVPSAVTGKFRDIVDALNLYAQIFNDPKALAQASAYEQYFEDTLTLVKNRTADISSRPSVYLAYTDLLHAYGNKSDMAEVIEAAGGMLASQELDGFSNVEVTTEQVLQWNPDFIFIDHAGSSGNASAEDAIAAALATGDFSNVTAVKNNRVKATPTGVFFWDSGIQKILYLLYIAKTLHPSLFTDIDLKTSLIDFYQQFFFYDLTDNQATRILNHQDPT
ncbi:MAG: ABC transporter substrate-binding protein [Coriobacteriia bacterium]|nr:ABC transporter substrate-binding protein [Coriobacteriia bacterium]